MSAVFVGDNDHGDRVPSAEVLLQMIDKLRKERDHARRLYCEQARYSSFHASPRWTAEEVAQKFGWDCFSSDILSQEVSQEGMGSTRPSR